MVKKSAQIEALKQRIASNRDNILAQADTVRNRLHLPRRVKAAVSRHPLSATAAGIVAGIITVKLFRSVATRNRVSVILLPVYRLGLTAITPYLTKVVTQKLEKHSAPKQPPQNSR